MPNENKIIRQEQLNRYFTQGVVPIRNDLNSIKEKVADLSEIKIEIGADGNPYLITRSEV